MCKFGDHYLVKWNKQEKIIQKMCTLISKCTLFSSDQYPIVFDEADENIYCKWLVLNKSKFVDTMEQVMQVHYIF